MKRLGTMTHDRFRTGSCLPSALSGFKLRFVPRLTAPLSLSINHSTLIFNRDSPLVKFFDQEFISNRVTLKFISKFVVMALLMAHPKHVRYPEFGEPLLG